MKLSKIQIKKIEQHAIDCFPEECCGFVVDGKYIKQVNISDEPTKTFEISDKAYLKYANKLQAIIHSHVKMDLYPSKQDMKSQINTAVPWGIILTDGEICSHMVWWGDQLPREPLIGREFVNGAMDCFSLVRDYYLTEHGLYIPDVPRELNWYNSKDYYTEHYKKNEFYEIDISEAKPGDGILMKLQSKVPNHGGIIVENNMLLHHLYNRKSGREPLGRWLKKVSSVLRHKKVNQ